MESALTMEEKKILLAHARQSIAQYLQKKATQLSPHNGQNNFSQKRGAFVTLHNGNGELRGCIGTIEPIYSTWEIVHKMAIASATRDPRFPPLSFAELIDCIIEISLLEVPHKISHLKEVCIGRDGLIVEQGNKRGLLLPQVATERNWSEEQFFINTLRKAGLSGKESFASVDCFSFAAFHFREQ